MIINGNKVNGSLIYSRVKTTSYGTIEVASLYFVEEEDFESAIRKLAQIIINTDRKTKVIALDINKITSIIGE